MLNFGDEKVNDACRQLKACSVGLVIFLDVPTVWRVSPITSPPLLSIIKADCPIQDLTPRYSAYLCVPNEAPSTLISLTAIVFSSISTVPEGVSFINAPARLISG